MPTRNRIKNAIEALRLSPKNMICSMVRKNQNIAISATSDRPSLECSSSLAWKNEM